MGYNQEIADKILERVKSISDLDAIHFSDYEDKFEEDDFKDTAKQLISSGQINAKIKKDYHSLYIESRSI
ncbi:hypothetical protein [Streptococcus suis]|uniref:hypothetical protein n=1 Tax=Streptococcus suis TaxID=1307 RepID=UPI001EDEF422|nr:hypothetical protein [Streptococcus suis]